MQYYFILSLPYKSSIRLKQDQKQKLKSQLKYFEDLHLQLYEKLNFLSL